VRSGKGCSLVIAAPVATVIVVLFNGLPFVGDMVGSEKPRLSGVAAFLLGNVPVSLFGAILAKRIDRSGAALTIARRFVPLVGTGNPCRALTSLFVFARGIRPESACRRSMTLSYPRNTPSPPPDER